MNNKIKVSLVWLVFTNLLLHAEDTPANKTSDTFTRALMAEEREHDLEKAADLYADVIERFDASRERAANAIFRSGECLWKLGEIADAKNYYERITREFADFSELVRLSQAILEVEDAFMTDEKEFYTISLSSHEPEICFEDVPTTLEELERKLIQVKEVKPEARIAMVSDAKMSFNRVNVVLKLIEKIGFQDVLMKVDTLTKRANEAQHGQVQKIRFKILGQVVNPGFYEVPSDIAIDLLDAIAIAGGYTRLANEVTLKYPVGEEEIVDAFKLRDLKRTPANQAPKIKNNSTIIVDESDF